MGYYVNTTSCDFAIRKENYDKAYRLLCALNAHDELKIWFSWMPWNYGELFDNAVDILKAVGFEIEEDEKGICSLSYDDKTGCEEEFLAALAPIVEEGSYIEWEGEEHGDFYRYEFDGKTMGVRRGEVVWY